MQRSSTQDILTLQASDFIDEFWITPYLTATEHLTGFLSEEHTLEFRRFRPDGFDLPVGSILAVGDPVRVDLDPIGSVRSVVDLCESGTVALGTFRVKLDEDHILIELNGRDKQVVDQIRNSQETTRESLFPSLYHHAISEAVRHLDNEG